MNKIPFEKDKIDDRIRINKEFNDNSDEVHISFKKLQYEFASKYDLPELILRKDPDPIHTACETAINIYKREITEF